MTLPSLTPQAAAELLTQGALLIDIRSADEYARQHIAGARNLPLAQLTEPLPEAAERPVIFHCLSGMRTQQNAALLARISGGRGYLLQGGLQAWKNSGLPLEQDPKQPLEIMRQVQIAAGTLVLLGCMLGASVTPAFYLLSAFVGAGLVFAGISGFCGMATLLMKMPWNRPRQ